MLGELESVFDPKDIVVKSYHQASGCGLAADSGRGIDHTPLQLLEEAFKNPSYSGKTVEIAKICNAHLDLEKVKKSKKKTVETGASKHPGKTAKSALSYLTEERKKFLEKYQASNQKVADRFFNKNLDALFPDPEPAVSNRSEKEGLTYDEAAKRLLYLLNEQEDEICFRVFQDRLRRQKRK